MNVRKPVDYSNVIKLSAGMLFPALNCFYVIKN